MYTIGIDPGLSGAIAVLATDGALVTLYDTPVLTLSTSRGTRQEYDVPGMAALLESHVGSGLHVLLEEAQAMPGQGTRSMFTTGYGFGIWIGVLSALQLPYTRVRPGVWKKAMGLGPDKEAARLRAIQLFLGADLRRKKDHGRAEALLLAAYGYSQRVAHPPRQTGISGHKMMGGGTDE